jgi:hypothetical protein
MRSKGKLSDDQALQRYGIFQNFPKVEICCWVFKLLFFEFDMWVSVTTVAVKDVG